MKNFKRILALVLTLMFIVGSFASLFFIFTIQMSFTGSPRTTIAAAVMY